MKLALATPVIPGGIRAMTRLDQLATCSSDDGALTRLYLTPAHADAVALVRGWMEEAGMATHLDAAATLIGRYPGVHPDAPVLLLGSHIDTVRNAGRYDGSLGVIVAIEAVAALHRRGEKLPFAIEVVAFGDQEGVRFPVTLTGSRALAGTFQPDNLDATDKAGISLRQALGDFGCDPDAVRALGREAGRTLGYVEIHIEQGPVLEAENLPVGIVTAINGASCFKVTLTGKAGHAGTVPMGLRLDAGAAAAEMMLATELITATAGDLVATVGACEFLPGAVDAIPGSAHFTVDIRSPDDRIRNEAVATLTARFVTIAARRGVKLAIEQSHDQPAARCDQRLIATLEAAVASTGLKRLRLASGASHDGLAMAGLCPIAMLFVRCKGGFSHSPAESVRIEDVSAALEVLIGFLRRLPAA